MPKFRFESSGFIITISNDPIFNFESWETEAINIHAALGLFAKEFNLTDLQLQNYSWLWEPNTLAGYTKDSDYLVEYCEDCNDIHGYWFVKEIT